MKWPQAPKSHRLQKELSMQRNYHSSFLAKWLGRLSSELLLMAVRYLPNQQESLSRLRLVLRRFDSIATPLKYTHIYQLSDKHLDLPNHAKLDSFQRKILSKYFYYTRHVRIQRPPKSRAVNWSKVLHFLISLKQFRFLRYTSLTSL